MSLESDLMAEEVGHLDLTRYTSVSKDHRVADVLEQMRSEEQNCALVVEDERLAGIFTERDVLMKVVDHPETWDQPIGSVMTVTDATIQDDDQVSRAVDKMKAGHFRNLPALDAEGRVVGNLTQEAIIKFLSDHFPEEVYNLPPDPEKVAGKRAGA